MLKLFFAQKAQQGDIERCFAQVFTNNPAGERVLEYLQAQTVSKSLGPASEQAQLYYTEGQRALFLTMLRMIERGRGAK